MVAIKAAKKALLVSVIVDVSLFTGIVVDVLSFCYQIPDFVSARADFGTDLAISTRTELDPGDSSRMPSIFSMKIFVSSHAMFIMVHQIRDDFNFCSLLSY